MYIYKYDTICIKRIQIELPKLCRQHADAHTRTTCIKYIFINIIRYTFRLHTHSLYKYLWKYIPYKCMLIPGRAIYNHPCFGPRIRTGGAPRQSKTAIWSFDMWRDRRGDRRGMADTTWLMFWWIGHYSPGSKHFPRKYFGINLDRMLLQHSSGKVWVLMRFCTSHDLLWGWIKLFLMKGTIKSVPAWSFAAAKMWNTDASALTIALQTSCYQFDFRNLSISVPNFPEPTW